MNKAKPIINRITVFALIPSIQSSNDTPMYTHFLTKLFTAIVTKISFAMRHYRIKYLLVYKMKNPV